MVGTLLYLAVEYALGHPRFPVREKMSAVLQETVVLHPLLPALRKSASLEVTARARRVTPKRIHWLTDAEKVITDLEHLLRKEGGLYARYNIGWTDRLYYADNTRHGGKRYWEYTVDGITVLWIEGPNARERAVRFLQRRLIAGKPLDKE